MLSYVTGLVGDFMPYILVIMGISIVSWILSIFMNHGK